MIFEGRTLQNPVCRVHTCIVLRASWSLFTAVFKGRLRGQGLLMARRGTGLHVCIAVAYCLVPPSEPCKVVTVERQKPTDLQRASTPVRQSCVDRGQLCASENIV